MADNLIIQPPRALGMMIHLQFDNDTRDDLQLRGDILQSITVAMTMAPAVRSIAIIPVAPLPSPGVPL